MASHWGKRKTGFSPVSHCTLHQVSNETHCGEKKNLLGKKWTTLGLKCPRPGMSIALRRASRSGEEADASEAPATPWRSPPPPAPLCLRGTPQTQRSPCLLHKILSRCRRKSECQGATNGAFEGD
uniref:Uncharacterized protein n=1 Tax=Hippocampus comes TaxID=109280 RepID=A0A3Q2Y4G4_HIPCM